MQGRIQDLPKRGGGGVETRDTRYGRDGGGGGGVLFASGPKRKAGGGGVLST